MSDKNVGGYGCNMAEKRISNNRSLKNVSNSDNLMECDVQQIGWMGECDGKKKKKHE